MSTYVHMACLFSYGPQLLFSISYLSESGLHKNRKK
jgi:hypothetical protein